MPWTLFIYSPTPHLCSCRITTQKIVFTFACPNVPLLHGSGEMPSPPSGRCLDQPMKSSFLSSQHLWLLHLLSTLITCRFLAYWASQVVLMVQNLPANAGDLWDAGLIVDWEDPLEEEMASHSSILARKIHGDRSPWSHKELDTTKYSTPLPFGLLVLWNHYFLNIHNNQEQSVKGVLVSSTHSGFSLGKKQKMLDQFTLNAQLLRVSNSSATLWTVARQAPLSMGLFRQEYWNGLPFL